MHSIVINICKQWYGKALLDEVNDRVPVRLPNGLPHRLTKRRGQTQW